ncbi:MAG TPA: DUF1648 domain-containing protein [Rhizomicrobium sp.]|nr:DUF1648 domain-containing protein [Rhizomicrobium sp.]
MRLRMPLLFSFLILAVMLALSAWAWRILPAGARITTHWDAAGNPNGFMPKTLGLLILPAVGLGITALLSAIPLIEPRRQNLIASRQLYYSAWIGSLLVIAVSHVVTVMTAAGRHVNAPQIILVTVSALMIVLGNYLGKSRSTFMVGVRLPWTLTSEYAWQKSNRLMGLFMIATGLAVYPVLYFFGVRAGFAVFAGGLALGAIVGTVSSYLYWRHDPNRQTGDTAQE